MTKKWNHIRQSELQCAVCHVHLVACMLWTSQANTNVERGRRSGASSIQDCQAACINNTQCTGLDWNSTAELGQRCSLSGPWSGSRYDRVTPGVTHFDLNRNCLQTGIFLEILFHWVLFQRWLLQYQAEVYFLFLSALWICKMSDSRFFVVASPPIVLFGIAPDGPKTRYPGFSFAITSENKLTRRC